MNHAITNGRFVVDVSGPLNGGFADWPANIQDKFHALVLERAMEDGKPYEIVNAFCEVDPVSGVASLIVDVEARYNTQ